MLEPALVSGLISTGINVFLLGPLPSNGLAMLTRSMRADLGIMITASHNLHIDNGIKLFGPDGLKLSGKVEKYIERLIDRKIENYLVQPLELGRAKRLEDANARYIEIIKSNFPRNFNLEGMKIVLDCANGAAYKAGPAIFTELGAKVIPFGTSPNGLNVNKNCGSTFPELMQKSVIKHKADIGIAFDGDADRVIICDEKGQLVDGDQILALIAKRWKDKKILKGGVIATHMSNIGLENFFKKNNINFLRTKVGDRYVKEKMKSTSFNLGGEQSGHIILGDIATTGDGILVSLEVLYILKKYNEKPSRVLNVFKPVPQILKNVDVKDQKVINNKKVKKAIKEAEKNISKIGRILVRNSGTESIIRVMGESYNYQVLKKNINDITTAIKKCS
jgi:phosphoglucosamine mutase